MVSDECQTFTVSGFAQVQIVKPVADFTVLTSSPTENLPVSFYNLTQNGFGYVWHFGDGNSSYEVHPTHTFSPSGEYLITLIATDMNGCVDSITKPIFIQEEFYIYIPNTFLPDDNRINDVFSGSFIGVEWIKIEVFNRWGERLFYSEDLDFSLLEKNTDFELEPFFNAVVDEPLTNVVFAAYSHSASVGKR